jgi:uncharacterized integral membrane protein
VFSALLLVLLAVLVTFNMGFTSPFSLFGLRFESVPIMAVALLSFAAGVVYSLVLYLGRFFHERRVKEIESRHQALSKREKEIAERAAAQEKHEKEGAAAEKKETGTDRQPQKPRTLRERLKSLW